MKTAQTTTTAQICQAEGFDSAGRRWVAVLFQGGHVDLSPVGHSADADRDLSRADEEALMDLVLPRDSEELDPRDAIADARCDAATERAHGIA